MPSNPAAQTPAAIALHKLPVQLRMLVRVMGEAAAFKLVELRGGTPLTVPRRITQRDGFDLAEQLGMPALAALVAELPGQTLQLPKNDSLVRQVRHQRVVALRGQGLTHAATALATGYTVRQVINIMNRNGDPEVCGQGDFFADQIDLADLAAGTPAGLDAPRRQADVGPNVGPNVGPSAHNPFGLQPAAPPGVV